MLWQVGVLLGTLAIAWLLARVLRRALDARRQTRYETLRFGAESLNRAFFPLIGAVLVWHRAVDHRRSSCTRRCSISRWCRCSASA